MIREKDNLKSSAIRRLEHDDKSLELSVYFKDGDSRVYSGVPLSVYFDLLKAPSVGGYFNHSIRDRYSWK